MPGIEACEDRGGKTVFIRFTSKHDPPQGLVRVQNGPERAFTGWLELMRELDNARETGSEAR